MGFFDKFKKEKLHDFEDSDIVAPVSGKMVPAVEISDSAFADELLGQTIGILPEDGTVVSPVNGKIVTMFDTGHAFGVEDNNGNTYLVHIGIDTVSMNGKGFQILVKQESSVKAGQPVISVDLKAVRDAGFDPIVMLIVIETPSDDFKVNYIPCGNVKKGQKINF